MYPKLFEIPFVHVPVWSYGLMMVIGFLAAVAVIRHLSRDITPDPQMITSAALYALIAGLIGARLFYVIHYWEKFSNNPLSVFAVWQGGLELAGGVALAITVIIIYLRRYKLPVRRCLDILAVGLLLALAFGRIGCFLRGCCYGKPTNLPWAVCFPYGSDAFRSQIGPNPARGRDKPQLELPPEYFDHYEKDGLWYSQLKPYESLTERQKAFVDNGPYRTLPVHPTQLYSSANALVCCGLLYLFRRRSQKHRKSNTSGKILFTKPGCTFALMFILYGITRFFIEFVRDDNPYELGRLTISQLIGIALVVLGAALMIVFARLKTQARAQKS